MTIKKVIGLSLLAIFASVAVTLFGAESSRADSGFDPRIPGLTVRQCGWGKPTQGLSTGWSAWKLYGRVDAGPLTITKANGKEIYSNWQDGSRDFEVDLLRHFDPEQRSTVRIYHNGYSMTYTVLPARQPPVCQLGPRLAVAPPAPKPNPLPNPPQRPEKPRPTKPRKPGPRKGAPKKPGKPAPKKPAPKKPAPKKPGKPGPRKGAPKKPGKPAPKKPAPKKGGPKKGGPKKGKKPGKNRRR